MCVDRTGAIGTNVPWEGMPPLQGLIIFVTATQDSVLRTLSWATIDRPCRDLARSNSIERLTGQSNDSRSFDSNRGPFE